MEFPLFLCLPIGWMGYKVGTNDSVRYGRMEEKEERKFKLCEK